MSKEGWQMILFTITSKVDQMKLNNCSTCKIPEASTRRMPWEMILAEPFASQNFIPLSLALESILLLMKVVVLEFSKPLHSQTVFFVSCSLLFSCQFLFFKPEDFWSSRILKQDEPFTFFKNLPEHLSNLSIQSQNEFHHITFQKINYEEKRK